MIASRLVLKPDRKNSGLSLWRWAQFLAGFGAGLAFALILAWDIMTPTPIAGSVESLRAQEKERYIVLVSMSYALNGDFVAVQHRLGLLKDPTIQDTVRGLAERYTNELRPLAQRSSLAKLAIALGSDSVTLRVYVNVATPTSHATGSTATTPIPSIGTMTPTPTAMSTVTPTLTPAQIDYKLFERTRLTCQQDRAPKPHVAIFVQDATGRGLPGVRVRIQWSDGEDTFFTGLKSSDPGYAEYEVQAGKSYSVSVMDGTSQTALDLTADGLDPSCPSDGKEHFRAWRVIFRRAG